MLTGVEILLERMKTNPEEFLGIDGGYSKWGRVMLMGREFFTEEERIALDSGLISARREMFNSEVLRVLTGNDEQEAERNYPYATTAGYAITANTTINKAPSKMIVPKEMVKHARQVLEKEFDSAYAEQDRILGLK
jgi:hypothetical protein